MTTKRVTERSDGTTTERTVERTPSSDTTVVRTGGGGGMGVVLALAVLALVALVAVFLVLGPNRSSPSQQVADAAGGVSAAASRAANGASDAMSPNR